MKNTGCSTSIWPRWKRRDVVSRSLWQRLKGVFGRRDYITDWLRGYFWAPPTRAGVKLDENVALTYSAVFNAVQLLSDSVKVLPVSVYEETNNGRQEAVNHPAHKLLHTRPNPQCSPSRFKAYLQACKLLWGNGYAEIQWKAGRREPVGLWAIHPSRVEVKRRENGDIYYRVRQANSQYTEVDQMNMFHLANLCTDGVQGISTVGYARESLGLGLAAERFGATFFGNGAKPGGVLEHPMKMSPEGRKRLREDWQDMHGGPDSANRVAILEEGMKYNTIGIPPDDAQFLETRQFQVLEVARWFNLPPHKLKDLSRGTYSNIEQQAQEYVTDSVMPHLVDWEDEIQFKLIGDGEGYFAKFDVNAILRADTDSRGKYYTSMWNLGAMTTNEIRAQEDMNPIGPAGDLHFCQVNMTTLERMKADLERPEPQPPAPDAPPEEPKPGEAESEPPSQPEAKGHRPEILAALVANVRDCILRMARWESKAVSPRWHRPDFAAWSDRFYLKLEQEGPAMIRPSLRALFAATAPTCDADERSATAARNWAARSRAMIAASEHPGNGTTDARVAEAVNEILQWAGQEVCHANG